MLVSSSLSCPLFPSFRKPSSLRPLNTLWYGKGLKQWESDLIILAELKKNEISGFQKSRTSDCFILHLQRSELLNVTFLPNNFLHLLMFVSLHKKLPFAPTISHGLMANYERYVGKETV